MMFHLGVNDLRTSRRAVDPERTPLLPVATESTVTTSTRPLLRAVGHSAERRALYDQASLLAFAGAGSIYSRQFFCNWVVSPRWAIAGLALKSSVAVANATVGRYATSPSRARAEACAITTPSRVPWRCTVPAVLAVARLVACPIGEAPAMAASFALHVSAEALSEGGRRVVTWSALGAYLVVRELMFARVVLPRHFANFDMPRPADATLVCNGQALTYEARWCDAMFGATYDNGIRGSLLEYLPQIFANYRNLLGDASFKPTLNHVETDFVVPLAHALDSGGPLPHSTPSQRAMAVGFVEDGVAANALVCLLSIAMLSLLWRFTWLRPRGH